jgi:hypothetical protein
MITHIVCWKYKAETSQEQKDEHLKMLKNLPSLISEIVTFDVGFDVLRLDRSFDTGLVSTFKTMEDLDAYTVHPSHQEVAKFGKIVAERVISVDF